MPVRKGDGTGLSPKAFSEIRKGDGTVLFSAGSDLITDGLVSRWTFEDDSDTTTATDSQGSYDGTINGCVYSSDRQEGAFSLQSDGVDDYVEVDHAYPTFDNSDFSVLGWVLLGPNDRAGSPGQTIFAGEDGNNNGDADKWWVVQDRNNNGRRWSFQADDGSTKIVTDESGSETSLDVWYHVAFVHTEGTGYELYIDGSVDISTSDNGSIHESTHSLYFFTNGRGGGGLEGRLDDVRVYDRALSQTEIQTIVNGDG